MIPWVVPGYAGSLSFRLYMRVAVAGARRARLIMADSEASRLDAIRVLRVPPSRVRTVYLGVEPPKSYTPGELDSVRARYGLPHDYAFYIGGFDRRKNVPLLLGAWKEAVDSITGGGKNNAAVLAIGGNVPEPGGINPDVRGEAAALGLVGERGPVRFLGYIPEDDKPLLMSAARVFAYPSAYEGFGLDPLEAMSLGTAVVSSWGGSLREVVGEGGLLVPPDDEAALARAILRAWGDDELRRKLSTQGIAHAARFTWERTAEETAHLYMLAARGRKRVPAR
jgi:glycosyltransferase involved in cell wall biosynthesis